MAVFCAICNEKIKKYSREYRERNSLPWRYLYCSEKCRLHARREQGRRSKVKYLNKLYELYPEKYELLLKRGVYLSRIRRKKLRIKQDPERREERKRKDLERREERKRKTYLSSIRRKKLRSEKRKRKDAELYEERKRKRRECYLVKKQDAQWSEERKRKCREYHQKNRINILKRKIEYFQEKKQDAQWYEETKRKYRERYNVKKM